VTGLCAVTAAPAAAAFGLGFLPLEEHTVELWIDRRWHDAPGVTGLLELIAGNAFAERLAAVGGYDLTSA
jgi:molybdate-binding protein